MRALVILWVVLFVITGCGDESPNGQHNSPPVIDYLIMPEKVSPGDSVELQVVAHEGMAMC